VKVESRFGTDLPGSFFASFFYIILNIENGDGVCARGQVVEDEDGAGGGWPDLPKTPQRNSARSTFAEPAAVS